MKLDYDKIINRIANMGMTIEEYCIEAQISKRTFYKVFHGCDVNTKTAGKIAGTLGYEVEEILK